jgi:hypothetical protein
MTRDREHPTLWRLTYRTHRLTAATFTAPLAVVTPPRFAYAKNSGVRDDLGDSPTAFDVITGH